MSRLATADRILRAARILFEREGATGVSMRRVAAAVGLTPMAIYRHFADKDALIDALVIDALDRWAERVAAIPPDEPAAWLETVITREFLDFALEEPRRFEAAFLVRSTRARRYPEDFAKGRSPAGRLWMARLKELRTLGRLAPDVEPLEAALTLWALGQGLITLYRAGRFIGGVDEFRAMYRQATRRCLRSFVDVGGTP